MLETIVYSVIAMVYMFFVIMVYTAIRVTDEAKRLGWFITILFALVFPVAYLFIESEE